MADFRLKRDSIHDKFLRCRKKVVVFGGGFANGKTASACVRAIQMATDYPGSNGLIARSTYPKLNDTIRTEFEKWCPKEWIQSFPKSSSASNTCTLTNGSKINFRYIAQTGKNTEHTSSNLLSATYDWIVVDQMEDPEIVYKDFVDLLGRLRGSTPYDPPPGTPYDETAQSTGPRQFIITCNPSRNWLYKKLVKPLKMYKEKGVVTEDLLVDDDTGEVIIELFEGSTYENKDNLEKDFIRTLEIAYVGQMRDRFLLGEWAAYEGLVYPQYDPSLHCVPRSWILDYYKELRLRGVVPTWIEGYDYGLAKPSCYLCGFVDHAGNVFILDGFHKAEYPIDEQKTRIWDVRRERIDLKESRVMDMHVLADPAIFKRAPTDKAKVGRTVANMFFDTPNRVRMHMALNNLSAGIPHVQSYLTPIVGHTNPFTGDSPAPLLYFAEELLFIDSEISTYAWKKDIRDEVREEPQDKDDHSLDVIRYMVASRPKVADVMKSAPAPAPAYLQWHEQPEQVDTRRRSYGRQ